MENIPPPSAYRVKCQKQDVGSTVTEFYTRWSNHKSHINTNKKTCTLAKHFIEQKCGLQNLKVTLIEKVKVKNLDYLEDREGHWQRQLFTMQPHGLNVRKEFEGGTTNLSLSITRFVCCSHRTQLSAYPFSFTFLFFLLPLSYMLVLCLSLFFIGRGWLDIHGVFLHFYYLSL